MNRLMLFLLMLSAMVANAATYSTITGNITDITGSVIKTNTVYFESKSTPLAESPIVFPNYRASVNSDTNGDFTVQLYKGNYQVIIRGVAGWRDTSFIIAVPTNSGSYNITALITNAVTYTQTVLPQYVLKTQFTNKGDLIVFDGTNVVRAGVGSDGQVLQADSTTATGVKYATVSGTGTMRNVQSNGVSIAADAVTINFVNPSSITSNAGVATVTLPSGGGSGGITNTFNANQFDVTGSGSVSNVAIASGTLLTNVNLRGTPLTSARIPADANTSLMLGVDPDSNFGIAEALTLGQLLSFLGGQPASSNLTNFSLLSTNFANVADNALSNNLTTAYGSAITTASNNLTTAYTAADVPKISTNDTRGAQLAGVFQFTNDVRVLSATASRIAVIDANKGVTSGSIAEGDLATDAELANGTNAVKNYADAKFITEVQSNGTAVVTSALKLNFVNPTALTSNGTGIATITFPTGGSGADVYSNSTLKVTAPTKLNFISESNTVVRVVDAGAGQADITVSSTGGGSQTPWTSDIDGAGFSATNVSVLELTNKLTLYGTKNGVTDYECLQARYSSGSMELGTFKGGTGAAMPLKFYMGGTNQWTIDGTGALLATSSLYNIGNSAQTASPYNIFAANGITAAGTITGADIHSATGRRIGWSAGGGMYWVTGYGDGIVDFKMAGTTNWSKLRLGTGDNHPSFTVLTAGTAATTNAILAIQNSQGTIENARFDIVAGTNQLTGATAFDGSLSLASNPQIQLTTLTNNNDGVSTNFIWNLNWSTLTIDMVTNIAFVHATNGPVAGYAKFSDLTIINDSGSTFTLRVPAGWTNTVYSPVCPLLVTNGTQINMSIKARGGNTPITYKIE